MDALDLEKLRRTRAQIHRHLARLEKLLTGYGAKLAEVEAGIRAIAPEQDISERLDEPRPVFRPRKLPRLALEVLQSADGPLLINDIAIRVLALKGVALPGPTLQNKMRHQLRGILISFDRRGITSGVGRGLETLRVLAIGDAASLKLTSDS